MAFAGGGVPGGQVVGKTDRDGGLVLQRPVTPDDYAATVYHKLGIDRDQPLYTRQTADLFRPRWQTDRRIDLTGNDDSPWRNAASDPPTNGSHCYAPLPSLFGRAPDFGMFGRHNAETIAGGRVLRARQYAASPRWFHRTTAAEPPLVKYPVCADFDERGRLYVCESSGAADWNKPQPKESLHRVLRLEDADGDGVFDRRTVFAEFEMMPEGSMWLAGSLYVAAAPIIWKLTDADDDGVAEGREEWVKTTAVTGCLNDLAVRIEDRTATSTGGAARPRRRIPSKGGHLDELGPASTSPSSAGTRHRRADGRRHGQPDRNRLRSGGERFVTSTLFQMLGLPRDDGIIHAVYGAVHPKDLAPVFEFPWTGPELMPPMTSWARCRRPG